MAKIKVFFEFIKKLFSIFTKEQKQQSVVVFVIIILSSFLEMLSISALLPFFYSILSPEKIVSNKYFIWFAQKIHFNSASFVSVQILISVLICFIFALKTILLLFSNYYRLNFQNRIMKESSLTILASYLQHPYQDMLDVNSSEALRDISTNSTSIYYMLQSIFFVIISSFNIVVTIFVLCKINMSLTLELFFVSAVFGILIMASMKKAIAKGGEMFNKSMLLVNKYAYEALNGLKEINVNNLNQSFINRYESGVELKRKAEAQYRFLQTCPNILMEMVFIVTLLSIVCFKIVRGQMGASMVPELAAIAYGSIKILSNISTFITQFTTIVYYKDSFNSAYNVIKTARKYAAKKKYSQLAVNNEKAIDFQKIELKNLKWKYKGRTKYILQQVNLTILKGESIGLIGPSGAGKTTLADIMLGVLEPEDKNIVLVDGIDIFSMRRKWAKTVGYIPQSVFLLDDTIRSNIIFGRNTEFVDDSQIWNVLEQAQLKDFVIGLPKKLDTIVGERGIKFSGGQRQRIAIARALFGKPNFLVLDEATSALDNETESAVMDAIEYLHGKTTMVIIAHRLSTIAKCDKIFEIKDGTAKEVIK